MTTTIPTLPRGVADYVAAFDLTSIARSRDHRLVVSRNPAGAESAWWCEAKQASAIVRRARQDHGDVEAAARALGVLVTAHAIAMQRSAAAVARIEVALAEAQRNGLMSHFNATYRSRREAALAVGKGFMSYGRAMARLRAAVVAIIARGDERLDLAAMRRVLD
jgi:hypothetical protein